MNLLFWARRGTISNRIPDEPGIAGARAVQGGQALVLFSIFLTVILGVTALVLDQGLLRKANMDLSTPSTRGLSRESALLKDDPMAAEKLARDYVQLNYPGELPDSDVDVSFRCLIGVQDGSPRLTDIPAACDPRQRCQLDARR